MCSFSHCLDDLACNDIIDREHETKCSGALATVGEFTGVFEGIPEIEVILNRAWLQNTPRNRNKTICHEHYRLLTAKFNWLMRYYSMCQYSGHNVDNTARQQPDIRKLNYHDSQYELRHNKVYAPFGLATCKTCIDSIFDQKSAPLKPKPKAKAKPMAVTSSSVVTVEPVPPDISSPPDPFPLDHVPPDPATQLQPQPSNESSIQPIQGISASQSTAVSDMTDSQGLSLGSQGSSVIDPSWTPTEQTSEANPGMAKMNELLEEFGMNSRLDSRLLKDFDSSDNSRKNKLENAAVDIIDLGLQIMTPDPNNQVKIWQSVLKKHKMEKRLRKTGVKVMSDSIKGAILYLRQWNSSDDWTRMIANLYGQGYRLKDLVIFNNPNGYNSKDTTPFDPDIIDYWPQELTQTKFSNGQHHYLLNGHSYLPPIKPEITRTRIPDEVMREFYKYVMSNEITKRTAWGRKTVKSDRGNQVYEVAKFIRNFSTNELARKVIEHLRSLDKFTEEQIPGFTFVRNCLTGALPATKSKMMKGVTPAVEYGKSSILPVFSMNVVA